MSAQVERCWCGKAVLPCPECNTAGCYRCKRDGYIEVADALTPHLAERAEAPTVEMPALTLDEAMANLDRGVRT